MFSAQYGYWWRKWRNHLEKTENTLVRLWRQCFVSRSVLFSQNQPVFVVITFCPCFYLCLLCTKGRMVRSGDGWNRLVGRITVRNRLLLDARLSSRQNQTHQWFPLSVPEFSCSLRKEAVSQPVFTFKLFFYQVWVTEKWLQTLMLFVPPWFSKLALMTVC